MTHDEMKEVLLAKLSEKVDASRVPPLLADGSITSEQLEHDLRLVVQRLSLWEFPRTPLSIRERLAEEVSRSFVQGFLDREAP